MPCELPGYTQHSVGTPNRLSAMWSSSLCGRGTRGSPSTTWISVGVFAFLMYAPGDWRHQFSISAGDSQYILSPRYHWRMRCVSLSPHIEIQLNTPAPVEIALKRSVCVRIQFDQWPPALQPSTPISVLSTIPCAIR